jgi:hypothetical protein
MTTEMLLLLCRRALSHSMTLHIRSVEIGRMEPIGDSGVLEEAEEEARAILELCDKAMAEVDRARGKIGVAHLNK